MSTSSSLESDVLQEEANELCAVIEAHLPMLRQATRSASFVLSGARFRLRQRDRNVVYRVKQRSRWFLKLTANATAAAMNREAAGVDVARTVFTRTNGRIHVPVIRVARDHGYLLSSEFAGGQLNLAIYGGCFLPLPGAARAMSQRLAAVGEALARLHGAEGTFEVAHSRGRFALLDEARALVGKSNPMQRMIGEWASGYEPSPIETSFVHGNFTARNVLVRGHRICVLDFENSGAGNRYEDLSLICSHLVLLRAVLLIPGSRASAGLSAMLDGYRAVRAYDPEILAKYLTMQLCQYYIRAFVSSPKTISARVAGLPVVKSRLERLLAELISRSTLN